MSTVNEALILPNAMKITVRKLNARLALYLAPSRTLLLAYMTIIQALQVLNGL